MFEMISDGAAVDYGDNEHLVVFFSAAKAMQRNVFSYHDYSQTLPHTKLFLREHDEMYFYLSGIPGLTQNYIETAEFIRYFAKKIGAKRVSCVGGSSGGFGAALIGHTAGVTDIHVTSTVTFLDRDISAKYGYGERWEGAADNVNAMIQREGLDKSLMDLRPLIKANERGVKLMRIHSTLNDKHDLLHSEHVEVAPHVRPRHYAFGKHDTLVVLLMRAGIISEELTTPVDELLSRQYDDDVDLSYKRMKELRKNRA